MGGTPVGCAVEEFMRVQGAPAKFHTSIKTESYTGIGKQREVVVRGLSDVLNMVNSEDQLLLVDDVFDSGRSMKAVINAIRSKTRKNTPEIKCACLWYKPKANKTDILPDYW